MGTLLQSKVITSAPGAAPSSALNSSVTAGSLLVALVSFYSTGQNGTITVTDNNGNSWTTTETNGSNFARGCIAYAQNANSGATTVTITSSGTGDQYITAVVCEFSGVETAGAFDVDISAAGGGTAANSGNTATLAQADSLVVGLVGATVSNAIPATDPVSGYTLIHRQRTDELQPINAGYKNVSATTAQSVSNTLSASSEWVAVCVVFKNSAGGGGGGAAKKAVHMRRMMAR